MSNSAPICVLAGQLWLRPFFHLVSLDCRWLGGLGAARVGRGRQDQPLSAFGLSVSCWFFYALIGKSFFLVGGRKIK